jgi:hypothetical protein
MKIKTRKTLNIWLSAAVLSLMLFSEAFAFQFQDLEWGRSLDSVKTKLRLKRKSLRLTVSDKQKVVSYSDAVFGERADIYLVFTGKGEALFMVKVVWEKPSVGSMVKEELIKQYGKPAANNGPADKYVWAGDTHEDTLALDCGSGSVTVFYSAGE